MYKHYDNNNKDRALARRQSKPYGRGLRALAALLFAFLLGAAAGAKLTSNKEEAPSALLPLTPIISSPAPKSYSEPSREPFSEAETEERGSVPLDSSELTVCLNGVPTVMELEDYLIGVVAAEMSVRSEPEALKAQAVAARTFAALHMAGGAKCKSGCTVCSDPGCCQAYMGQGELVSFWGSEYEENIGKIRAAVHDTEGLVATYEGKLISALYHASSGPLTESSEEVFAMALPYLVSVSSCEGDEEVISTREFTAEEAARILNEAFPQAGLTVPFAPTDFEVWGRSKSGRVQLIRIGGTVITGQQMRSALGLKSTAFEVEQNGSSVKFTCEGYGHGVGMSQTGANEMAKDGYGFEEILKHFYTGTELKKLTFGGEGQRDPS